MATYSVHTLPPTLATALGNAAKATCPDQPDQLEVWMMSHYEVRLFHDDASIVAIGEGLLAATLPRDAWTHEGHLAACCWLLRDRPDIAIERELPAIISSYNIAL